MYRLIMPISFLGGATLVIWADVLARLVNQPYETPIGLFYFISWSSVIYLDG